MVGVSEISGEITSHLAALGAGTRDRVVFAILTRNPHFIEDEAVTDADGVVRVDITNVVEGLLLRFRDGALERVRTTIRREGDYFPFPRPAELITGLDLVTATREDLGRVLGDPLPGSSDDAGSVDEVRHAVDGGNLTATFAAGELVSITVTRG